MKPSYIRTLVSASHDSQLLSSVVCERRSCSNFFDVYQLAECYTAPGLEEGRYTIDVTQAITAPYASSSVANPVQTDTLKTHQEFEVYGLHYSLPHNAVHQSYPPQGHADYGEILPHIVFNDPHLPWEAIVSSKDPSPYSKPPVS